MGQKARERRDGEREERERRSKLLLPALSVSAEWTFFTWESSDEDSEVVDEVPWVIRHPGWTNFVLAFVYMSLGVAFLATQEGWSTTTAAYVVVQIITTIGYGDVTVTTYGGMVFMTVYVLLGTVIIAKVVNDVCEAILDSASSRVDESLAKVEHAMSNRLSTHVFSPVTHRLLTAVAVYLIMVAAWVIFFSTYESCSCSYGVSKIAGCAADRCTETDGATKTWVDSIYMAVITFSTVGFGDFSPKSQLGRVVSCALMILGVLSFANLAIAARQRYYTNRMRLSVKGFEEIDSNGNGTISRTEFRLYMLFRQGRVTSDQLQQLDRLFDCMDRDRTGMLSFEEISKGLLDIDLQ
ncbi:unnamed protein product [Effrenium voratum]|nr:unnamed protein product [Effrenium voratum]